MKNVPVLGKTYEFPEIRDDNFRSLQEEIKSIKETIDEGSKEQKVLGIFVKPPTLDDEQRIALMEELADRYQELISTLKSKIGLCREGFTGVGQGVQECFDRKIAELAEMEKRRSELIAELRAAGQEAAAAGMEDEAERIRSLTVALTNAAVLIVKKLRHALEALEILANDEYAQREVLGSLKTAVGVLRKTHQYNKDMAQLQKDIEDAARLALRFDDLLRDKLGPLSILVDQIGSVDARLAESLAEIEKLSFQLESRTAASSGAVGISDRVFSLLVSSRVKADAIEEIFSTMPEETAAAADFETRLAAGNSIDFTILAENMSALVDRGLRDLRTLADPPPAPPVTEPAQAPSTEDAPIPEDYAPLRSRPAWRAERGDYSAAISRADPTLVLFLLDRSGSMEQPFAAGLSKADYLARTVDGAIAELAVRCSKADGIRDYFHIACLGFGNDTVANAFPPELNSGDWAPISRVASRPRRLEADGKRGSRPVWIESEADGSTPLRAAFARTCAIVAAWCDAHPRSYPPTVICVTDGDSTDGDFSAEARALTRLHTDDGEVLLFNLHVDSRGGAESLYPDRDAGLDEFGRKLFELSSPFPPHLHERARASGLAVSARSRFFAYRAGAESAARFFELGTRPARLS